MHIPTEEKGGGKFMLACKACKVYNVNSYWQPYDFPSIYRSIYQNDCINVWVYSKSNLARIFCMPLSKSYNDPHWHHKMFGNSLFHQSFFKNLKYNSFNLALRVSESMHVLKSSICKILKQCFWPSSGGGIFVSSWFCYKLNQFWYLSTKFNWWKLKYSSRIVEHFCHCETPCCQFTEDTFFISFQLKKIFWLYNIKVLVLWR